MLTVEVLRYSELPDEVDKGYLSNNGSGKELAQYLVVKHNGEFLQIESDAMEPEDVRFSRDLSWVKDLIEEAYQLGVIDGKNST